jgi:hypothetical protein
MNGTFNTKEKKYHLVKDGKDYVVKAYEGRERISLITSKQG